MKHFKIFMTSMVITMALICSACGKGSTDQDIQIEHQSSSHETEGSTEESMEKSTGTEVTMEFEAVSYNAVAIKNVRIRTTPEILEDNVYRQLDAGKGVKVVGYNEEWCKVVYDNMIMYVATEYLVEGEPVPEPVTIVNANGTTNTKPIVEANGKKVAIDAGHQKDVITGEEAIGPDTEEMTDKQTTGNTNDSGEVEEYVLTLKVAMYLKEELLNRGYEVFMIREKDNCSLSDAERGTEASKSGSDVLVSLHANMDEDASISGGLTIAPSNDNPYVTHGTESEQLSTLIAEHMTKANGFTNHGVLKDDGITSMNWSTIPTSIVKMGFLSNKNDTLNMSDEAIQKAIAKGIADGIDAYFGFEVEETTEEVLESTEEVTEEISEETTTVEASEQ